MPSHSGDRDEVKSAVGVAVAAAAQPVSAGGLAATRWLWCDSAEFGERRFGVEALGVVAGGDKQLPGDLGTDAVEGNEVRRDVTIALICVVSSLDS